MKLALPAALVLAAALAGFPAGASASPDSLVTGPVQAVRVTQAIDVDGKLDEGVWQEAPPITRWLQSDQNEGQPASERTEVRVAFDDDAIYVAARMWDTHPDSIVARLCRRDQFVASDRFLVFLDPLHDRRSGYYFVVTAAGVLGDGTLFNDSWDDNSWDGVWQGKVRRSSEGWTAEMRIPFSQLRFRHGAASSAWGINFRREITRRNERDWLVYPPRNESGFVSRFPELHGLGDLHPRNSIELTPYATGKAEFLAWDPSNPFRRNGRYTPSGGADLRMSVGSRLTLNATVNPDFGQVEVDPAVVNLSDVESFFQEKRPFFVENGRIFSFGNEGANDYWGFNWPEPTFIYSRRIGRSPQRDVSDADWSDIPLGTHILGAAKVTGQIAPGLNFGTMHALTARENGRLDYGGLTLRSEVEPLTYYGVGRGLREFKDRKRGLGIMTSLVQRGAEDRVLRDQLNETSLVTGLDGWIFIDKKQNWVISGYSAMSHVRGTEARINSLQQSSRHYFQRPDQNYMDFDPNATSLTGWVTRAWLNKQSGKHFFFNSALGAINPKFDTNDIGFQTRSDVINGHLGMGWGWNDPNRWRKWANVLTSLWGSRDFGGVMIGEGLWTQAQIEFINNYSFRESFGAQPETRSDTRTRGGPRMLNPQAINGNGHFDTDSKSKLFYFVDWSGSRDVSGSWGASVFPGIEMKPSSSLLVSVGPGYERARSTAGYVAQVADPVAAATYGARYLFADLSQTTVSAQIRVNWSFTPNLSLQTFIQPLISSGRYTGLKELARPGSYDFTHYAADSVVAIDAYTWEVHPSDGGAPFAISNPEFNVKSLRGNAVLRWEYSPGSTLYFVWTQERSDYQPLGQFDIGNNFDRLVEAQPNNIFLVKATYYLSR